MTKPTAPPDIRSVSSDPASFEQLVKPHLKLLWQTAYRFTGHREDAEDLLQELLVRLLPQHKKLLAVEDLRPWLMRSLYHLFVDRRRHWLRSVLSRIEPSSGEAELDGYESQAPGPEEVMHAESLQRTVFRALATLDSDQRAVVVLHDMEGYTLAELQTTLDVPIGTLKSRLFRARRRLQALLGGNLFAEGDVLASERNDNGL